jgi:hypothetical protein
MTATKKQTIRKIAAVSFILLLLAASAITAQNSEYSNAFGVRAGGTSGITYKHQFGGGHAMEIILQTSPGLTALYEKHNGTKVSGLNWYIGGGAHVRMKKARNYFVVYKNDRYYYYSNDYYYGPAFGIDAVAGLEYKISSIPLAFSCDIKPNVEFWGDDHVYMFLDPSVGIKLAF